jgi:predicted transcriptional regulator
VGFFTSPFLVFIALFVWIGASQENNVVQMKSALGGIPVNRAMLTEFRTLGPSDPLARVVEMILAGSQQDFPVVENNRVVGILPRSDLMAGLSKLGQGGLVSQVMRTDFQALDSSDMLEGAAMRLQSCDCHTLPVMHGGQLVGLLTMENMGEFLMIRSSLGSAKPLSQSGSV